MTKVPPPHAFAQANPLALLLSCCSKVLPTKPHKEYSE